MMQPLQGAVDVQAALRCSMSPDFAETATDRFTPATDGHPAVSKMQFVADLLIKLGVVQVSVLQVPAALASKVLLLDCRCSCAHTTLCVQGLGSMRMHVLQPRPRNAAIHNRLRSHCMPAGCLLGVTAVFGDDDRYCGSAAFHSYALALLHAQGSLCARDA